MPIGALLIPLALFRLKESYGPEGRLDLPGLGLVSAGLFGIVWGLVRGNSVGWASPQIVTALLVGLVLVAAFVAWELRTEAPMLPMRFFRNATFALAKTTTTASAMDLRSILLIDPSSPIRETPARAPSPSVVVANTNYSLRVKTRTDVFQTD